MRLSAPRLLLLSFAALILGGAALLALPFAGADGHSVGLLDALFTSTSAICVTGLVTVDTATAWSPFGKVVLLLLIQVGGLGILTLSTFLALSLGRRVSLSQHELVDRIASWVARAVVIDATDLASLERVEAATADTAVVSMGSAIDRSILTVLHLKQLGVTDICVKAVSDDHARILKLIGATRIIHPEREVAEQLAESLKHPSLRQYLPLLGDYAIVETATPAEFVGRTLGELSLRRKYGVSVIAAGPANDTSRLMAPSVDGALAKGDLLVLIGQRDDLDRFERAIRLKKR